MSVYEHSKVILIKVWHDFRMLKKFPYCNMICSVLRHTITKTSCAQYVVKRSIVANEEDSSLHESIMLLH